MNDLFNRATAYMLKNKDLIRIEVKFKSKTSTKEICIVRDTDIEQRTTANAVGFCIDRESEEDYDE